MKSQALGMIETKGLIPAIEAGDAGVKAANVKLLGYEIVQGGLVMVAFVGNVAAVQASVNAGSAAAAKVGLVISEHVIPRPEVDLGMVFKGKSVKPDNDIPPPDPEGIGRSGEENSGETVPDIELEIEIIDVEKDQEASEPSPEYSLVDEADETESTGGQESAGASDGELESMTVRELRRLARKTPDISIRGQEVSLANKDQLIKEILRARGGKD